MARKTVIVSDLTGAEVTDPVAVTLVYNNGTRETIDANKAELGDVIGKGKIQKRRGRPPKTTE